MFTGRGWEIALGVTATLVGAGGIGLEAASLLTLPKLLALPSGVLRAIALSCTRLTDVWRMLKEGMGSRAAQAWDLLNSGIALIRGACPAAGVLDKLTQYAKRAVDDLRKNWVRTVLYTALLALALYAIGFTPAGVIGGSVAAFAQSYFYGGQTCGLFSFFQSLGTWVAMPALGTLVLAAIAAVLTTTVVFRVARWLWSWWNTPNA